MLSPDKIVAAFHKVGIGNEADHPAAAAAILKSMRRDLPDSGIDQRLPLFREKALQICAHAEHIDRAKIAKDLNDIAATYIRDPAAVKDIIAQAVTPIVKEIKVKPQAPPVSKARTGNAKPAAGKRQTTNGTGDFPGDRPFVSTPDPTPHTEIPESADGEPIHEPPGQDTAAPPKIEIAVLPPLTLSDWRNRDLPEPDFIMGNWLTTTTRVLLTAATGLGKTNVGLALGIRIAAGVDFLHWRAHRPARVLYIDGEMSRRLLRQRVLDEERRVGATPEAFFALSHEDIEQFKPLNTIEGQAWMNALIEKIGGVDLVIIDNIMSLTVGDMKDPEPWQQTIPWALSLTKAAVGQVWIHHTGHDDTRSYGDKTREWQMDTVAHLDAVKRDETDISFSMSFKKARERTPATRFDFQDVKIALINDRWEHELTDARRPGKVSAQTQKAVDALTNVLAGDQVVMLPGGRRAAHRDHWAAECSARGLIDVKRNEKSATTMFNRFRRELVAANLIACEGDLSWLLH